MGMMDECEELILECWIPIKFVGTGWKYKHSWLIFSYNIVTMADKKPKRNSSKYCYYDEQKAKRRKQKSRIRSQTPPLPHRSGTSTEELLLKRDSLKKQLQKFKHISRNGGNQHTEENRKRKYTEGKDGKQKRYSEDKSKNSHGQQSKSAPSKSNIEIASESEDEESIIEKRRIQRKQLLKKFNQSHDDNHSRNTESIIEKNNGGNDQKLTDVNPTSAGETDDFTDMFSEKDDFKIKDLLKVDKNDFTNNSTLTDNWDDHEGYYKIRVGDVVNNRFTIKDTLGQGVFANVVRAQDNGQGNNYVAIKIIRNNELMYKTGLKEISILKEVNEADPENKYHCVQFLGHFMHKGHLCLVLESLHIDLRCVLKKYGKNHGLNMKAIISYSRQLLLALRLLKKVGIVHADIKPDNILVNEKKNILKLCDFGSAAKIDENEPTPYLVSRYYRAPEIILGIPYKHGVDLWSSACTIYEMTTGKILFTGSSNNKMLKCFMDLKGKIPNKLIRKGKFKDQHFNYNYNFLLHKKDEFTGRDKLVEVTNINANRDLNNELRNCCKNMTDKEERKMTQLKDLLDKMLTLDSSQRYSVADCLKHPFVQDVLTK